MSREKQIEEMAKLACTVFDGDCTNCSFRIYPPCPPKVSAERLYNAGYRKQSEGEWLNAGMFDDMAKCSVCGLIDHSLNEVYSRGTYNFCPNCGAKMTRKEDAGK